jgi:putative ABC transport system ATP-binding protein/lipoprotein-releasing system ATP-binding protein
LGLEGEQEPDAREFLKRFDIADKADKFPSQLSGGEQQRVAIARALIMNPRYIFADEPTGNLDTKNGQIVMNTLMQVNREKGSSIILVTHEPDFAALAQREIYLIDGRISTRAHDQMSFQ